MSTTPVNVQVPSSPDGPVVADFVEHAIRAAYVNRAHLRSLPEAWNDAGVYVLLTDDGSGRVYVGKAVALRKRLQEHARREKLPWMRAIAMNRDTTHGFNSAEIGYLEGRLAWAFAFLSTESSIYRHQPEYYVALQESREPVIDAASFIDYMLGVVADSLITSEELLMSSEVETIQ